MAKLIWTHKGDTYCAECSIDDSNVVFSNTPLKGSVMQAHIYIETDTDVPNVDFERVNRAVRLSNDTHVPLQIVLRWFNMVDDEFIVGLAAHAFVLGDQMKAESIVCRGQSTL